MGEEFLDYPQMLRDALRRVPREALGRVAEAGMPKPHHFYLGFRTDHPEVVVPSHLREAYPEEMTVVLEHQFRDLEVDDEGFSVTLYFGGQPARLHVPFEALTVFVDPSVDFGLRFDGGVGPAAEEEADEGARPSSGAQPAEGAGEAEGAGPANVVSIDRFRKK